MKFFMKKCIFFCLVLFITVQTQAQIVYTMGYEKASIEVIDPHFFSTYKLPDLPGECGVYDKASATFYTCDYKTYRYIDEDFVIDRSLDSSKFRAETGFQPQNWEEMIEKIQS